MLYNDTKTLLKRAKEIAKNCDTAKAHVEQVKAVLQKYAGKSITGNKKRFTEAIQAINKDLYARIEWSEYRGADLSIYWWDRGFNYTDKAKFYILQYHTARDNTFDIDKIFADIARCVEYLEKRKERALYTAKNATKIDIMITSMREKIRDLQLKTDNEIVEMAGIRFN